MSGTRVSVSGRAKRFRPVDLSGCVIWLRSDLGIVQSNTVSQWNDLSVSANNASNAAASQQPVYTARDAAFNNLPSLQFTGDASNPSNLRLGTLVDVPSTSTIFVVCSLPTGGSDYATVFTTKQYLCLMRSFSFNNVGLFFNADSMSSSVASSTAHVYEWVVRAANDADVVVDGASQTVTAGTSYRANGNSYVGYGGGGVDTVALVKKIAEVTAFNRALTTGERSLVRQYLGNRYNITVT